VEEGDEIQVRVQIFKWLFGEVSEADTVGKSTKNVKLMWMKKVYMSENSSPEAEMGGAR